MIAFICLFFPAVLSVWMYEKLTKADLSIKNWLYHYTLNTTAINLFCFLIKKVVLGTAGDPFYTLSVDTTPSAALNYLIVAIPTAVLLVFFKVLLSKTVRVTAEDERDEKD